MPNFWPRTGGVAAHDQRERLKAEVERRVQEGEIFACQADEILDHLFNQAGLRPRAVVAETIGSGNT
jgi:hypothetical protein